MWNAVYARKTYIPTGDLLNSSTSLRDGYITHYKCGFQTLGDLKTVTKFAKPVSATFVFINTEKRTK